MEIEKKTRVHQRRALEGPPAAYSVIEFCKSHGFSKPTFYKLVRNGEGPRLMRIGARTLISAEAAAEFRRQREGIAA
jgi:hypothetical protein